MFIEGFNRLTGKSAGQAAEDVKNQQQLDAITCSLQQDNGQWKYPVRIDGESFCLTREDFLIKEISPKNLSVVKYCALVGLQH